MSGRAWLLFLAVAVLWGIPYLFIRVALEEVDPIVVVFVRVGIAALILLPVALFQLPSSVPSWEAAGSVLALTVGGTALAQLVLFRMLALLGSARLSLVTYLMPAFALVYGALVLDEQVTWWTLGGLALILAGVALASGAVRLRRREVVTARP